MRQSLRHGVLSGKDARDIEAKLPGLTWRQVATVADPAHPGQV